MSPFERRLRVLRFIMNHTRSVTINDILNNDVIDINQSSLNDLLGRLVDESYLVCNKTTGHTKYYKATEKTIEQIKA